MPLKMKYRMLALAGVAAALGAPGVAMAQSGPPSMPAITFPVDTASIATVVVAAGAVLLLAYFGPKVGFSFAKKLLGRLHKSV